jgi:arginyl-tRNA synthetase
MKEDIKILLNKSVSELLKAQKWDNLNLSEIVVDYAKNEQFGDYTSNVAMVLAKKIGDNPMKIAEKIAESLNSQIAENINLEKVEIAAPGYINFFLSSKYFQNKVLEIGREGNNFGKSKIGNGIKIDNEFISANPTGPLHLGDGRGGFYGDALSNVLRKAGFEVTNEYYVNDAGEQVVKLGHSVLKDSEAVYAGEYINELNKKYKNVYNVREIGEKSGKDILENIIKKTTNEKMQIKFDAWISEKSLYDDKYVDEAIEVFKKMKLTEEKDEALWLKTKHFGDDKDRVLIKSDGQKTYFASDCGYIRNKINRGFQKMIEIWGADHHGYVNRFRAASEALGFQGELKFIIVQLVRLVKDGKEVRMSKRAGNVVYIDDLIDEVGHDVARFFFLMYSPDTHMNFDLGLAKEQSQKNPVFYVQYAHARICSILEKSPAEIKTEIKNPKEVYLSLLTHEKELSLMKELSKFPELVEEISQSYMVHKLPQYAIRLADKFHSFYDACRIIDETNLELSKARLVLSDAVRIVLSETLKLIGVNSPNKM